MRLLSIFIVISILFLNSYSFAEVKSWVVEDAIQQNDFKKLKELLELGVNKNDALVYAAWQGRLKMVAYLADNGADINSEHSSRAAYKAIHSAVSDYNFELIKLIIKKGGDVNVRSNSIGETALMMAAQKGNFKIVKLLLDSGADITIKDDTGHTALDYAQENGNLEIYKLLKKTLNIKIP